MDDNDKKLEHGDLMSRRKLFGENMRRLREMRGHSKKDIIHLSKIAPPFIDALEAGDFDQLPGQVFGRGFVQSICAILEIDAKEMIREYNNLYINNTEQPKQAKQAQSKFLDPKKIKIEINSKMLATVGVSLAAALVLGALVMSIAFNRKNIAGLEKSDIDERSEVVAAGPAENQAENAASTLSDNTGVLGAGTVTFEEVAAADLPLLEGQATAAETAVLVNPTTALKAEPQTTGLSSVDLDVDGEELRINIEKDGGKEESIVLKKGRHNYSFKDVLNIWFEKTEGVKVLFNGKPVSSAVSNPKIASRLIFHNDALSSKKAM
mgnify:CR=1 FL=1